MNDPRMTAPHWRMQFWLALALISAPGLAGPPAHGAEARAAFAPWEREIKAFEASDKTQPPPQGALLFVGSSSIRLWKTLSEDFPSDPVINRGFGGSHLIDSTHFADRIILPCKPKTIVLYAGDNDLAAKKTPRQVLADFQAFAQKIQAQLPGTRIAFVSIKPSAARWHLVEQIQEANRLIGQQ